MFGAGKDLATQLSWILLFFLLEKTFSTSPPSIEISRAESKHKSQSTGFSAKLEGGRVDARVTSKL